jgi:hypothetical protein
MLLGALIIVYRPQIKNWIGAIPFAERYLGMGGTYVFLLLLGLGVFVLSLMWALGTLQSFLASTFGGIL